MIKRPVVAALLFLTIFAGTALAAPGNFTLLQGYRVCTGSGGGSNPSLTMSWTVSAGATSYSVVRNGAAIGTTTSTTFEDTNVTSGTSYTYYVIATDGTATTTSNSISMTAPYCTPPENPSLTATAICLEPGVGVRLNWTSAARTEFYEVYRNGVRIRANLPASTLTYTDMSVTVGTSYSYYVRAENLATSAPSGPESDSNTVTLEVTNPCPPPPAAPTVNATASCGTAAGLPSPKVTVTWTAPAGATSYTLWRNGEPVSGAGNLTTTTYQDLGVAAGSTYTYQVYANGAGGQGPPGSATVNFPENICTPGPTAPTLQGSSICTPGNTPAVHLTWTASTNATSYTLFRNGAVLVSGLTTLQYMDTPTVGTLNAYYVRAVNSAGTADSNTVSIMHADVCPKPPGAFSSSVSVICSNNAPAVHVTWTASSGATSYAVIRNGASIASGLTGSSYDDKSVTDGATYSYIVRATNANGSTDTGSNSVTVADPCPRPPGALTLTGRSFCSGNTAAVSLSWTEAARAVSYTVLRNGASAATGLTGTSYQDTDVVPGNAYTYVVRALNANGSTDSNPFSVTPSNCNTTTPRADLAVSNVLLSRTTVNAGETVQVTYTIANNGPAAAGETLTRIRIGETVVFGAATPPLAAGASRTETSTINVPSKLSGPYNVFVSVNDDRAVDETTFSNNVAGAAITVNQQQCQVSCLVNAPQSATAGQLVTFTLLEQPSCPFTVTWQFGNGLSGIGESATSTYGTAGVYNWTVVVTGAGSSSCANTGSIQIVQPEAPSRRRSVRH